MSPRQCPPICTTEVIDPIRQRLGCLRIANVFQRLIEQRVARQLGILDDHLAVEQAPSSAGALFEFDFITKCKLYQNAPPQTRRDAVVPEGGVTLWCTNTIRTSEHRTTLMTPTSLSLSPSSSTSSISVNRVSLEESKSPL